MTTIKIETAKSGRTNCKLCNYNIKKGEKRVIKEIGTVAYGRGQTLSPKNYYYCMNCNNKGYVKKDNVEW